MCKLIMCVSSISGPKSFVTWLLLAGIVSELLGPVFQLAC